MPKEVWVAKYKGYDIYYYPAGVLTYEAVYRSTADPTFYKTLAGAKKGIDKKLAAEKEAIAAEAYALATKEVWTAEKASVLQAQTIIADIEKTYERFLQGKMSESAWFSYLEAKNNQLKALGWPEWEPPPPKPETGDQATIQMESHMAELVDLFKSMGIALVPDPDFKLAASLALRLKAAREAEGFVPEAAELPAESPVDRAKAAEMADVMAAAAIGTISALAAIGIGAEAVGLGQIEKVFDGLMRLADAAGLGYLGTILAALRYEALVIEPARQYWRSKALAYVPPVPDLRLMAVREAFPVEGGDPQYREMEKWAAYHGLDPFWTERYLWMGFDRMDVRTAIENYWWGFWTEDDLKRFLRIADIHPDDWEPILRTIWRNPSRLERRHGYIMGTYNRDDLIKYFRRDGLSPEDSETAADAMIAYALEARRNAVYRAGGRIYRDTLRSIDKQLEAEEIDQKTAALMRRRAREDYIALLEMTRGIDDWRELWALRYELEAKAGLPTLEELEALIAEEVEAGEVEA